MSNSASSARPANLSDLATLLDRQALALNGQRDAVAGWVPAFPMHISRLAADLDALLRDQRLLAAAVAQVGVAFTQADGASLGLDRFVTELAQGIDVAIDAGALGLDAARDRAYQVAMMLVDAGTLGLDQVVDADRRARLLETIGLVDLGLLPASTTNLDLMQGSIYELNGLEFEVGYGEGQVHPLVFLQVIAPLLIAGRVRPGLLDRNYMAGANEQQAMMAALNEWVAPLNRDIVSPELEAELILTTHKIDLRFPGALDFSADSLLMADAGPAVLNAIEVLEWAGFGLGAAASFRAAGRIAAGRLGGRALTPGASAVLRAEARALIVSQIDDIAKVLGGEALDEAVTALSDIYSEELGMDLEELVGIGGSINGLWNIDGVPALAQSR